MHSFCHAVKREVAGAGSAPRWILAVSAILLAGCLSPGERARLIRDNEALRRGNEALQREVAQRDGTVALLQKQVSDLQGFGDRPLAVFAPVKLEIASLSGGVDLDGKPGDDGVAVHLRLYDADGDAVKVPGRVAVQLLDNSRMGSPRVVGLYVFDDMAQLRKAWHGRFGTQHYTLKCPFAPGVELPAGNKLEVRAEFVDYLTGATWSAIKEVTIAPPRT